VDTAARARVRASVEAPLRQLLHRRINVGRARSQSSHSPNAQIPQSGGELRPQSGSTAISASDRVAGLESEAAHTELGAKRGGLTGEEAAAVLEREGANELGRSGRTLLAVVLSQVRSPLLALRP
jgi:Cation transporter/ATPase, N-terminus